MMGSLLAGVEESPGTYFFQDGMRLKHYQGLMSVDGIKRETRLRMSTDTRISTANGGAGDASGGGGGSAAAAAAAASYAAQYVAAGVSGAVVDKGPMNKYMPYLCQSLRHALQDMGAPGLTSLWQQLEAGKLRFELRSPSAQREGGVHDLHSFQRTLFSS